MISMYAMFYNCHSLKTLNLKNFDTSSVNNMQQMFASCYSLEFLDIISFNTSNVKTMEGMFMDCHSLKSLNLYNFDTSKLAISSYMFININNDIVICNDEKKQTNIMTILSNYSFNINCSNFCLTNSKTKIYY